MAAVRSVAAVAAVRRVRHVLRQQHLLAVGLAPESLGGLRRIQGPDRFHGLTGLVTTEEIQRCLPQRGKLVLLLLAHSPSFTPLAASAPDARPLAIPKRAPRTGAAAAQRNFAAAA